MTKPQPEDWRRDQSMDQTPFRDATFAENPEPRVPCVLLLDLSGSMVGPAVAELAAGLEVYKNSLLSDSLAASRVELAIVKFGGSVEVLANFATASAFQLPVLTPGGGTPMGAAIGCGIDMVQKRKAVYRANGIGFYRPWIFLITDGAPTDSWQEAAQQVKQGEASKAFSFFAVGVENADFEILGQISTRKPLRLKGLQFSELFNWLSNSQQSVSRSTPGEDVPLKNPAAPDGWATV
jgi:uncharacterized protein YegL